MRDVPPDQLARLVALMEQPGAASAPDWIATVPERQETGEAAAEVDLAVELDDGTATAASDGVAGPNTEDAEPTEACS